VQLVVGYDERDRETNTLEIFSQHDQRLKAQLVKRLDVKPQMRVLDLGCGRGAALPQLIEAVTDTGSITAIDRDQDSLDFIQTHFRERLETKTLQTAQVDLSFMHLPYSTDHFDRILCHNVIESIMDKPPLLNECYRILKPGGRLLLSHHDFDTATYNSNFKMLNRNLIHIFCDSTQSWQDTSDGQIGRKLAEVIRTSHFKTPFNQETILVQENSFDPNDYGYQFCSWISVIAQNAPDVSQADLKAWSNDLGEKAENGEYYFSISVMCVLAQKPIHTD
jgi:ubiquinone/menaquinone biosynthesis C-methylase UbiE